MPAAELFGDARTLATEDAAELATVDEMVRTSLGGGLKPALREIAGTWVGIGAVAVLIMVLRHGWSVDLDVAHVLVAASVAAALPGLGGRARAFRRWTIRLGDRCTDRCRHGRCRRYRLRSESRPRTHRGQ